VNALTIRRTSLVMCAVVAVTVFVPATRATAKKTGVTTAFTKEWAGVAPTIKGRLDPKSRNVCNRGETRCVEIVAAEMTARGDALAATCDHAAPFVVAYRLETKQIASIVETTFADPRFLSHLAAVFGKYYFDAYDNWHAGRTSKVPEAWQIALDAAKDRQIYGIGDLLLGMNAHITRDLPYVLEAVGTTAPNGQTRKPDFEKVNDLITAQQDAVVGENARRFDPSIGTFSIPVLDVDEKTFAALIVNWREESWRNGARLLAAKTPREHAAVAAEIEATATSRAIAIRGATTYLPFIDSTAERDAYCQAHHNDG
jgi:hypothetical protein